MLFMKTVTVLNVKRRILIVTTAIFMIVNLKNLIMMFVIIGFNFMLKMIVRPLFDVMIEGMQIVRMMNVSWIKKLRKLRDQRFKDS